MPPYHRSPLPLALLLALLASACAPAARPAVEQSRPGLRAPRSAFDPWIDSTLRRMTIRQKAAQMVWPQVYGDYTPSSSPAWQRVRRYVAEDQVGGFHVSIGSPTEIAAKLNALQRLSVLPLLMGADFETGAGMRARGGWFLPNAIDLGGATWFPPNMALGAAGDTALAYAQGRVAALEGRALGVHVDFGPVLDVNNNPANPVINTRSYGEDPRLVARLGTAFVRGVQDHGMLATAKHFPGHGDTEVNSHLALPTVGASRARLDSVELVPFAAAVRAGVGAVMTFHGAMPALDPSGAPGTLSRLVVDGLLRDSLGFDGLVISDAMDMRGVLDRYGPVEAAVRAVEAGADVLIQPVDVRQTIDAVVGGVAAGRYDERRLDRSVRRILAAKAALGLHRERVVSLDRLRDVVGDTAHQALARRIARQSITLVRDSLRLVPLGRLDGGARVLSVTYARRTDLGAGLAFDAELRRRFRGLRTERVSSDDPAPDFQRLLRAADSADLVLVGSYVTHASDATTVAAPRGFAEFVRELVRRERRVAVLAFGNPYLLMQVPEAPTYVIAWGAMPVSQQAAARALLGEAPVDGRLPITIPGLAAPGSGIAVDGTTAARAAR